MEDRGNTVTETDSVHVDADIPMHRCKIIKMRRVIPFLENHTSSLNQLPPSGSLLSEGKVGLRRMYQVNQKALHIQCL